MNIPVGRIVRYALIVWGLAAVFIVAEEGFGALVSWAIAGGWVMNRVDASKIDSAQSAAQCRPVAAAISNAGPSLTELPQSRVVVWQLGLKLGVLAGLDTRFTPATPEQRAPFVDDVARIALALGIAAPTPFSTKRTATAIPEFAAFVTSDANCAAAALEARLSPRHAALYRFGALAGYSYYSHRILPEAGPLFAPEMRTFGAVAGVPDDLVRQWISPAASGGSDGMNALLEQTQRALLAPR